MAGLVFLWNRERGGAPQSERRKIGKWSSLRRPLKAQKPIMTTMEVAMLACGSGMIK